MEPTGEFRDSPFLDLFDVPRSFHALYAPLKTSHNACEKINVMLNPFGCTGHIDMEDWAGTSVLNR